MFTCLSIISISGKWVFFMIQDNGKQLKGITLSSMPVQQNDVVTSVSSRLQIREERKQQHNVVNVDSKFNTKQLSRNIKADEFIGYGSLGRVHIDKSQIRDLPELRSQSNERDDDDFGFL